MNKEAKAIVDYLEEEREAIRTLCYYPDDVLNCEDLIMVMDYINQLETNIEEAIEYIKHSWRLKFDQIYDTSKCLNGWEAEELLSILERSKKI